MRQGMGEQVNVLVGRVVVIGLALLAWEVLAGGLGSGLRTVDPVLFSRPSRIAVDLYSGFAGGQFTEDLLFTLQAAMSGLVLGMATGMVAGFVFAYNKRVGRLFDPIMAAFNSLPRPALGPVLMLIFGLGMTSKVLLSWSIVFFVVFYNTYQGGTELSQTLTSSCRILGASPRQLLRTVVLPSALGWAFAAFPAAIGFALIGVVVAEFFGSPVGLGFIVVTSMNTGTGTDLMLAIAVLATIGAGLVALMSWAERRVLHWRPEHRAVA